MPEQKKWKYILFLLAILIVSYLPLSSFHFGMKNDAFSDNFPNKYFLSEAIHSGMNPLWNPYINFGFPLYADMGFAFWNPITWIFAIAGYNVYTLTIEVLLYLFIAGITMFYFSDYLKFSSKISLALASMYMCSGFFAGSIQYINFITAAAFLPAALQCLLQLFNKPSVKNAFLLSVAWYMILAGGHPALPIGFAYFNIVFVAFFFFTNRTHCSNPAFIARYLFLAVFMLLLFYLPAIYSYINVFPFYARNHPVMPAAMKNTGFSFSSFTSFLLPFFTAIAKNIFSADVAMRNIYFSISGFILMLISLRHRNSFTPALLAGIVLSILLATRGQFEFDIFKNLPLLAYIQTNGEFRVFGLLCFIILAGFGLDKLLKQDAKTLLNYTGLLKLFGLLSLLLFVGVFIFFFSQINSEFDAVKSSGLLTEKIKTFLQNATIIFLLISIFITGTICWISFWLIRRKKYFLIIPLIILDLIINTILYLPVTGVGQITLPAIQSVYNLYPAGLPIPPFIKINDIDTVDAVTKGLTGDPSYYNKKIGTRYLTDYPSSFSSTEDYFNNDLNKIISDKSYLFTKSSLWSSENRGVISVKQFEPCHWSISVQSLKEDSLVLLQNYYKYWKVFNNKKEIPLAKSCISFMAVPLHKGQNNIEFVYQDNGLFYCLAISFVSCIICLILYFRKWRYS